MSAPLPFSPSCMPPQSELHWERWKRNLNMLQSWKMVRIPSEVIICSPSHSFDIIENDILLSPDTWRLIPLSILRYVLASRILSKIVSTLVPNLELMQKDKSATLAWTLEVDEEQTILHKFESKPDYLVITFDKVSYSNIVNMRKKEKNGDLTQVILTTGPTGLCNAATQMVERLQQLNTEWHLFLAIYLSPIL